MRSIRSKLTLGLLAAIVVLSIVAGSVLYFFVRHSLLRHFDAALQGKAGALAGLVMLPFAVPLLIFGAGSVEGMPGALKLLGAVSLLLVAGCPFVAGAAIRMGRS